MSDEDWLFLGQFLIISHSGRRARNHRKVLDGIFWVARTGSTWRNVDPIYGKWSSIYRQFRRWTLCGLWDDILKAIEEVGDQRAIEWRRKLADDIINVKSLAGRQKYGGKITEKIN